MKYVLDENGNVKLKEGKILLAEDDGKEITFDAIASRETIVALHKESADHRKKASERGKILEKLEGVDIDKALEAMKTVENLSSEHKLQVESLKEGLNRTWLDKYAAKEQEAKTLADKLYDATVTAKFATSEVVKKTILTSDIAAKVFGTHFKADGTAVDYNGNQIYSSERPGEAAGFDEALDHIINMYPNKNSILRSSGANGSGSHNSGPGGNNTLSKFYDKKSGEYSLTEQSKIANTNPTLHQQLSSTFSK